MRVVGFILSFLFGVSCAAPSPVAPEDKPSKVWVQSESPDRFGGEAVALDEEIINREDIVLGTWLAAEQERDDKPVWADLFDAASPTAAARVAANAQRKPQKGTLPMRFLLDLKSPSEGRDLGGAFVRRHSDMVYLTVTGGQTGSSGWGMKLASQPSTPFGSDVWETTPYTNSNFSSFLTLRDLQGIRGSAREDGWYWSVTPWHLDYQRRSGNTLSAQGADLVVRGQCSLGSGRDWRLSTYAAGSHTDLDSYYRGVSLRTSRLAAGAEMRRIWHDAFSMGARADYGFGTLDRLARGSVAAGSSSYLYGELNFAADASPIPDSTAGLMGAGSFLRIDRTGSLYGADEEEDDAIASAFYLQAHWNQTLHVGGFTIRSSSSVATTYALDRSFRTELHYLNPHFDTDGDLGKLYSSAAWAVKVYKNHWSVQLTADGKWSGDFSSRSFTTTATWDF